MARTLHLASPQFLARFLVVPRNRWGGASSHRRDLGNCGDAPIAPPNRRIRHPLSRDWRRRGAGRRARPRHGRQRLLSARPCSTDLVFGRSAFRRIAIPDGGDVAVIPAVDLREARSRIAVLISVCAAIPVILLPPQL